MAQTTDRPAMRPAAGTAQRAQAAQAAQKRARRRRINAVLLPITLVAVFIAVVGSIIAAHSGASTRARSAVRPSASASAAAPSTAASASPSAAPELAAQVRTAFAPYQHDAPGSSVTGVSAAGSTVTLATSMFDKPENLADARGVCRTATAVASQVSVPFDRVVVDGSDGQVLAQCEVLAAQR